MCKGWPMCQVFKSILMTNLLPTWVFYGNRIKIHTGLTCNVHTRLTGLVFQSAGVHTGSQCLPSPSHPDACDPQPFVLLVCPCAGHRTLGFSAQIYRFHLPHQLPRSSNPKAPQLSWATDDPAPPLRLHGRNA